MAPALSTVHDVGREGQWPPQHHWSPRPAPRPQIAHCALPAETLGLSPPDVSACCSEAAFAANSAASCRSEVTFWTKR